MTRFGIWALCRRYETTGLSVMYDAPRSGRPREISALQRVAVEQPACCNPSGLGLEMTHLCAGQIERQLLVVDTL